MPNFNKSEFIKWSSEDESGKFSYTGLVVQCTDDRVDFITSPTAGIMSVPLDEGKFKKTSKPANWDDTAAATAVKEIEQHKQPKPKKVKKSGTKAEKAVEIYRQLMDSNEGEHPSRSIVIDTFIKQLDMTSAGAATYYATVKKRF